MFLECRQKEGAYMKEKFKNHFAWLLAKLIKPFYKNRDKLKSKEFLIISASLLVSIILLASFGSFVKASDTIDEGEKLIVEKPETQSAPEGQEKAATPKTSEYKSSSIETSYINPKDIDATTLPVYALVINDQEKMYFRRKEDAEKVLKALEDYYIPEDENVEIIDLYFEEKVEIKEVFKNASILKKIKNPEEGLEFILKGTDEERKHKIEKGENYWVLADAYGISVDNLIKANPDIKPERLQIGQEVSLIVPEPLINVCTVENVIYDQKIEFEVVYEDDSSIYKDEYRIKNNGVYGSKEITAELVKRDGKELGKVILDESIESEPVTKVVARGTKNPPPRIGTGTFSKPLNRGTITSGYGSRYHPVYRIYKKHSGIDIAAPYGSPVLASDGGKVIFAGWKSSYGKSVIVDHGGNLSSLYAHMSSINVSVGEKIYKGKTVGKVGSTGTSTGNHLHFEIQKLGNDINPSSYINLYNYY
jgi:murein DD-endopeptidase MepM/ murein hydrolase activator NlpD